VGGNKRRGAARILFYSLAVAAILAISAGIAWYVRGQTLPRSGLVVLIANAKGQDGDLGGALYKALRRDAERFGKDAVTFQRWRKSFASAAEARTEGEKRVASVVIWGQSLDGALKLGCEFLRTDRHLRVGDTLLAEPDRLTYRIQSSPADLGVVEGWIHFALGQDEDAAEMWDGQAGRFTASDSLDEQAEAHLYQATLLLTLRRSPSQAIEHLEKAIRLAPSLFAAHYNLAVAYGRWCDAAGSHKGALEEARAAIALRPESPQALELLGDVHMLERRWESAVSAYQTAIEQNGQRLVLWAKLGQALSALGRQDEADTAFRQVLSAGHQALTTMPLAPPAVWAEMGLAYSHLGSYDQAVEAYQMALKGDAFAPQNYLGLARVYKQQGLREQAIAMYRQALALDSHDAQAHYELGDLYRKAGRSRDEEADLREARREYRAAIEIAPCEAEPHLSLAQIYFAQGEYALARTHFEQGLAIAPDDAWAQCALGMSCYLSRAWDDAIRAFERAVSLAPDNAEPYFGLGSVYLHQQKYALAVTAYTRALTLVPNSVEALTGLGDAYQGLEQFKQAEGAYKEAIKLEPTSANTRLSLALLYEASGELERAASAYQDVLALQDTAVGHAALASVYQQQGNLGAAAREYEQALILDPGNESYEVSLALVYIAQDRMDEALNLIQPTIARRPQYALAHFLLGLVSEKKGDKEGARQAYEAAVRYSGEDQSLRRNAAAQLSRLRQSQSGSPSGERN